MATHAEQALSFSPVQAIEYVVDCAAPHALPSQQNVSEWTGQNNFAQVYATRGRLMVDIARAWNSPGVERIQLVRHATGEADRAQAIALVVPARPQGAAWQAHVPERRCPLAGPPPLRSS